MIMLYNPQLKCYMYISKKMAISFGEEEFLACCGSHKFAKEMAALALLSCVEAARDIWLNKVDVSGWLEAFGSNLQIGQSPSSTYQKTHPTCAQSTPEMLAELKRRYPNRPIIEFEIAAQEQLKITQLRIEKLYSRPQFVA